MWRFRKAGPFSDNQNGPPVVWLSNERWDPPSRGFYHLSQLGTSFIQAVGRDANPSAIEIRAFRLSKDARDPRDLGRFWKMVDPGPFLGSGFFCRVKMVKRKRMKKRKDWNAPVLPIYLFHWWQAQMYSKICHKALVYSVVGNFVQRHPTFSPQKPTFHRGHLHKHRISVPLPLFHPTTCLK